ncbi:MAG: hypothetical protein JWO30_3913 [Fibrobacteres bacterium]|nr:hypothetical protein [Fibrobacterota bacterium]
MRKSTTVPFLALCFAGILTAAKAAPSATTASSAEPAAQLAQAAPAAAPAPAASPAAAATPVAAAPAKADSLKPAKSAKSKKAKSASPAKDSLKTAVAAPDSAKKDPMITVAKPDSAKPVAAAIAPVAVPDSAKNLVGDTAKTAKTAGPAGDSAKAGLSDSAKAAAAAVAAPAAVAASDSADSDSTQAKSKTKKRKRVVRETTVNTIDELKGKYRSPKKALFMSMVVPGLGQAYVGQNWFNYSRGAVYFLADVAMIYGWHHYVVTRQNAQIRKYQTFADSNWRQARYEDTIAAYKDKLEPRNQHRESYCDAVQDRSTSSGNILYLGCLDPKSPDYESFQRVYDDRSLSTDSVAHIRSQFPNPHAFYEEIGKQEEFITGWNDAQGIVITDSAFYAMGPDGNALKDNLGRLVLATTTNQQTYVDMRAKANDYARMQAYFLGGIVINHIVSAVDAALAAHYHNKALYQTETTWYDRLRLDSQLAWDGYAPTPTVTASFTF